MTTEAPGERADQVRLGGLGAFWAMAGVLIALAIWFGGSDWRSGADLHTNLEVMAAVVAASVATLAMLRVGVSPDNLILFVGLGFVGTALLDGYHALVTSRWLASLQRSLPESLIPWSWNASRTYLAALSVIALWGARREDTLGAEGRIPRGPVLAVVAALTLACFAFFALVPLPRAYYPEYFLGRPEELVAGALFLWALVGFARRRGGRRSPFERWLIGSLVVHSVAQIVVMSRSHQLFDAMFDMAHVLKIVGYLFVVVGMLFDVAERFHQAARSDELLRTRNALLDEVARREGVEATLRDANAQLVERAEEIAAQRSEALRLLEDVDRAREAAEAAEAEVQRQAEALAASNRELEQFAYVASHDLQEPLRKVTAFGNLLADQIGDDLSDDARVYLSRMLDAARRMRQLIDDLLAYSRVASRGQPMAPSDLGAVLAGVLEDLETSIVEADAEIIVGPMATLEGDDRQLRQLLQNLISNALKYRREGVRPRVEISATQADGGLVVLRVTDNGIGFDTRFLGRIFAPFQRLHGRGEYSGTGIGLALCHRIVARHDGQITAESTPGAGSTFVVTLPVHQPQPETLPDAS